MFLMVAIAVVVGFLVILAMKKTPPPISQDQLAAGYGDGRGPLLDTLTLERLERLCGGLLQELGLEIERTTRAGGRDVEILAVNPAPIVGGRYLIHAALLQAGEVVEAIQVLVLSDAVKGEGASKGVLLTNGFFSDEAAKAAAGGPVELINGARFQELLRRYDLVQAAPEV
jgi:restriction system protein